MRVLALDLATRTGWALWDGARIESGVQDFTKSRGESNGMLFLKFNRWLWELTGRPFVQMGEHSPPEKYPTTLDLIVFEQAHHRGGAATEIAVGLMTRVLEFCALYGIEHTSVHSMTLKKWATGSGKASKEAMVVAAIRKKYQAGGIQVAVKPAPDGNSASGSLEIRMDDNEADAILLLAHALEKFGGESPWNARPAAAAARALPEQSTKQ